MTFNDLAIEYFASPQYQGLAAASQRLYRKSGDLARTFLGDVNADDIQMPQVLALRDQVASTPAKANELVKIIRIIYGHAIPRGRANHNPASFGATSVRALKGGSHLPWPENELARFLAKAPASIRNVVLTCLYTGQRIGDVLAMLHDNRKGDVLHIRQQKTGKELRLPLHPRLKIVFDDLDRISAHILTSATGKPWTYTNWNNTFPRCRAKILGRDCTLTAHGLRKNAVHQLLLAGNTTQETGAITGQTNETVTYYATGIDQQQLAIAAMDRWAKVPVEGDIA